MSEKENNILIVEDSELNITVLTGILEDLYDLYVARDGQEGVDLAKDNIPDLILLDIVMPKKDGYEVFQELKAEWATKDIPIVFLTALNNVDDERKGLLMGADDYINKPFDPLIVQLRVGIQMKIVNQLRTIKLLNKEVESWMKDPDN